MAPIAERNNFDELIDTIKSLIPATYFEDECSKRYKASFSLKEFEAELSDDPLILEGICRIEISGITYEDKGANQTAVDPNKFYLNWKVLPNTGEALKVKHIILHKIPLNKMTAASPWDV